MDGGVPTYQREYPAVKLWRLARNTYAYMYEYNGFVIRAPSEDAARVIAAEQAGNSEEGVWTDARRSSCEELSAEGEAGVIIDSFNAG